MENNHFNTISLNHTEWYMVYLGWCIMFEGLRKCLQLMLMSLGISTNCMFGWMSTGFPEYNSNKVVVQTLSCVNHDWHCHLVCVYACWWVFMCVGVHVCYDSTDGRDRQQRRKTGWGSITYPDKAFIQTLPFCLAFMVSLIHSHTHRTPLTHH